MQFEVKAYRWLAVMVFTLILLPACGSKQVEQVKVGVVLPLSGEPATYGEAVKQGIDLALEEISKEIEAKGFKISLIYEDSQGEPKSGVGAMNKLVNVDEVPVVIGGAFSSVTLAIAPIAEENEVVLISPISSNPQITFAGDYIFRVWPSDTLEGKAMAELTYEKLKFQRMAILYVKNDYGQGLKDVCEERFKELGGGITAIESFKQGDTDFRTQLAKIKASNPEAIYAVGYVKELARLLKQAKEIGISSQILSCVAFYDPVILDLAADAAEGVIFTAPSYDPKEPDKVVQAFAAAFKAKYGGKEPGIYEAHGYDSMKVVAHAIEEGGITSGGIRKAMADLKNFPGAAGTVTFDEYGDVTKPPAVFEVKDGKFVKYSP